MNHLSPHLTPKQLAERLRVTERTLRRLALAAEGPPFLRVGPRRILYPVAGVERWEAERLATATTSGAGR